MWFPLPWSCHLLPAPTTSADSEHTPAVDDATETPAAVDISDLCVSTGVPSSPPDPPATMIMDGLETLTPHHSSAFLLTESAAAAAAHHFNVLSFDTCLYKGLASSGVDSGSSPTPASGAAGDNLEAEAPEPPPGDLNTPVTTSGDVPSFFGPSTVVEPPPITGQCP